MNYSEQMIDDRAMLRHTVATLAYRGGKALRDVPAGFATFQTGGTTRTPGQILAHIGDLLDWGLQLAKGSQQFHESEAADWPSGVERFFTALAAFDAYLASDQPLGYPPGKIFQGPVADALTHIGQIAMLRRMAGGPVRGENYFRAEIVSGRVGNEQATPMREFD